MLDMALDLVASLVDVSRLSVIAPALAFETVKCGRPYGVWGELTRLVRSRCGLRGLDTKRRQARGSADPATSQVRVCKQSKNDKGAWPDRPADAARPRRRSDRRIEHVR